MTLLARSTISWVMQTFHCVAAFALATFGGCGGLTGPPDVVVDAATTPASHGQVVTATAITPTHSATFDIPATSAGDQIYALLTGSGSLPYDLRITAGEPYSGIETGGNVLPGGCNNWFETFHPVNLPAGIATISVESDSEVSGYVLVLSGLTGPVYEAYENVYGSGTSSPAHAPSLAFNTGNVVVSLIGTCYGPIDGLAAPSDFTPLPANNGLAAAYLIGTAPGWLGATWETGGEDYLSFTRVLW